MTKFTTALLAAAVLVASASAALAAPGVATGNANVRAGAGTGYAVISSVQYGQRVDIEYCSGNWCHVAKSGRDGWVSASYLATINGRATPSYGHDHGWGDHRGWTRSVGINTCVSGQNASFCFGF